MASVSEDLNIHSLSENCLNQASEVAQWIKVMPSSVLRTPIVEGENQLLEVVL